MKPLYKFILDEETGNIEKVEIADYEEGRWVSNKLYWRYKYNSTTYYCYNSDLDKFKNGHVYSFNPSIVDARLIIADAVHDKAVKAEKEAKRWHKVYNSMFK